MFVKLAALLGQGSEVAEAPPPEAGASGAALQARLIAALRAIHDPEIPVNIYDLGLIYRLDVDPAGRVEVDMTLTAPACPVAGTLPGMVASALRAVEGVTEVAVELVWDPPWSVEHMSEEARLTLGMLD